MEFYATPKLGVLYPCDSTDADQIRKMRQGEVYRVKVSMPRNIKFHRKFFALLQTVWGNLPESFGMVTPNGQRVEVRSVDDLLWHIKMQLGHYDQRVTLGGRVTYEAKSISFASMDESEFHDFYGAAIDVIIKYFLVGADRDALEEIVAMHYT